MPDLKAIEDQLFRISTPDEFNALALEIFHFQYGNNQIYRQFVDLLNIQTSQIQHFKQIPFLPIEFFKTHEVRSGNFDAEAIFTSSGTTGMSTSRHMVKSLDLYQKSFMASFKLFFGEPKDMVILALLPSYMEREGSSLVYMANALIEQSQQAESGFYLHDLDALAQSLKGLSSRKKPTLLLGVTYALLDLAEKYPIHFPELMLMETGGMKGQRKEMVRTELHQQLSKAFGIQNVYSEYGMTELLSQAYSKGQGKFHTPPWMKVVLREMNDPFTYLYDGKTGGVNVIDLANLYSCSFIATQDLGKQHPDGSFEVLGRFDNSDLRGCNLMVE